MEPGGDAGAPSAPPLRSALTIAGPPAGLQAQRLREKSVAWQQNLQRQAVAPAEWLDLAPGEPFAVIRSQWEHRSSSESSWRRRGKVCGAQPYYLLGHHPTGTVVVYTVVCFELHSALPSVGCEGLGSGCPTRERAGR